jgi:hypothetical protein
MEISFGAQVFLLEALKDPLLLFKDLVFLLEAAQAQFIFLLEGKVFLLEERKKPLTLFKA